MNTVTFETARRLKEAGFKQPQFDIRQTWYSIGGRWPTGTEIYIAEKNEKAMRFITVSTLLHAITGAQEAEREGEIYGDEVVFAPTATDILRKIGRNRLWKMSETPAGFGQVMKIIIDPEAAALAWLKIHDAE